MERGKLKLSEILFPSFSSQTIIDNLHKSLSGYIYQEVTIENKDVVWSNMHILKSK